MHIERKRGSSDKRKWFIIFFLSSFAFLFAQHKDAIVHFKTIGIGSNCKADVSVISDTIIEITAGGKDTWGTHDEFAFHYREIQGDFDFSVQVVGLKGAHAYTKAGIMARTALNDSSQHLFFQLFSDNRPRNNNNGGVEFQFRKVSGGETKAIYPDKSSVGSQYDVNYPNVWIRLQRRGAVFNCYFSRNQSDWKLYTSLQMDLPKRLYLGLAATAHHPMNVATATFGAITLLQ